MPPSGNDSASAEAIYRYMYAQYMERLPTDRTEILWRGPIYEFLFLTTIILFFYAVVFWMRPRWKERLDLKEITSFAGHLTEQPGRPRRFDYVSWAIVTVYAGYFAVKAILMGTVY